MSNTADTNPARVARVVTWLVLKIVAALAALFILLRFISPTLMTRHDDLSFWAGAAYWPLALVLMIWAAIWIGRDLKRIQRLIAERKRLPRVL